MTHVKALLVDDLWAVIGTTNLDNRSFEHNDEVNVAVRDDEVTARSDVGLRSDLRAEPRDHARPTGSAGRCGKSSSARSRGFSSGSSSEVVSHVRESSYFVRLSTSAVPILLASGSPLSRSRSARASSGRSAPRARRGTSSARCRAGTARATAACRSRRRAAGSAG